jgi:hypothetical protein
MVLDPDDITLTGDVSNRYSSATVAF